LLPRLLILGSAPFETDVSRYIDESALVLRFNECKNLSDRTGSKADFLCVTNIGSTTERFIRDRAIGRLPLIDGVREIWLPRCRDVMLEHSRQVNPLLNEWVMRDQSDELIESNGLSGKQVFHFSVEHNLRAVARLTARSARPFLEPSTGFLAIEYILSEARFADYEKVLLGFGFTGWAGHPWDAEKEIVMEYAATRTDFHVGGPC
jgi:hypothetical protein